MQENTANTPGLNLPDSPWSGRSSSPSPSASPTPALFACPPLERSVSVASSATTVSNFSQGSASSSRTFDATANRRRGFARPQGTSFAESARHRDSVMCLGSIAHLQHYFARTGLLDGKGAQLYHGKIRKREARRASSSDAPLSAGGEGTTLDDPDASLSVSPFFPTPTTPQPEYAGGLFGSPSPQSMLMPMRADDGSGGLVSPRTRSVSEERYGGVFEPGLDPMMLPPTVSTYRQQPKEVPRPPKLEELRGELRKSLGEARKILQDVEVIDSSSGSESVTSLPAAAVATTTPAKEVDNEPEGTAEAKSTTQAGEQEAASPTNSVGGLTLEPLHDSPSSTSSLSFSPGWNMLQGLNILDTMTLAIRAAKMYYTAHERPERLASFKPERELRGELLGVLDTLKRMAVRNFAQGVREPERSLMLAWIDGVLALLRHEARCEEQEQQKRLAWRHWMHGDWTGREREREWAFLQSFEPPPSTASATSTTTTATTRKEDPLPPWTAVPPDNVDTKEAGTEVAGAGGDDSKVDAIEPLPTPFLKALQSGLRLVRYHNEMVRQSRKPWGHITAFHTDTLKPYRCADNLRFWVKAAELRWDIVLRIDVMGVVHGRDAAAWRQFDRELLRWCARVRQELTAEWGMEEAEKGKEKNQQQQQQQQEGDEKEEERDGEDREEGAAEAKGDTDGQ